MRITVLGCGGSAGVPVASGDWGACDPDDPRNRRRRPCILIEAEGARIVVDTGPDFREQWLSVGGGRLDAVIYTHAHADHIHGIDDLKSLCTAGGGPIDVYGRAEVLERIRKRFPYAFAEPFDGPPYFRPCLNAHPIGDVFSVAGVAFRAFEQQHGRGRSTGLRIGTFAYSTDVSELDEKAFDALDGIETWIVGAGHADFPSGNHAFLPVVLEWVARLGPKRALLTHLNHHMDYRTLVAELPDGVEPAVDGMILEVRSHAPAIISHNIYYAINGTQPIDSILEIMAALRAPSVGCPWDIEQNFETIAPYTIEEAYEVAEAIRAGDIDALCEELGDLLFQVVFHARMAEERGAFAFNDVVNAISAKMIARHPHVFGSAEVANADMQTANWEAHKERERQRKAVRSGMARSSVLDDVPLALPALMRAEKLQSRAARIGFDWPNAAPVFGKVREELDEIAAPDADIPAEIGDLIFSAVNLARKLGVAPETALRDANARFEQRFRRVETLAHEERMALDTAPLAELDRLWNQAKREERDAG